MKNINRILAAALVVSCLWVLPSCNRTPVNKVTGDIHDIVDAVNEAASYDGLVSEFLYKESDTDEMICWTYGVIDIVAYDHLTDYVITMPTDYNQTFALLVFDDEMTDTDYDEVITAITNEYIHVRASSLQMYMPDEYEIMAWAEDNTELVFRRYDNALALIIYGQGEATELWTAFEAAALK